MKLHRLRLLSASLALAACPFMGAALSTPAWAAGPVIVAPSSSTASSTYGLAARLPKDTEGFLSFYHLSDLWDGFKNSNFLKKVMANEKVVKGLELDQIVREWENNAEMRKYGTMAASMLGNEILIATPAGFTESLANILKQMPALYGAVFTARISRAVDGDGPGMPKQMYPVVEALSDLKVPPFMIAFKAGAHREDLNGLIQHGLSGIPAEFMSKLEKGTFQTEGHTFNSLVLTVGKVMPDRAKEEMTRDLARAADSEEKGTALAKKLQAKTVELAYGWVDDYFVISVGSDHNHVKFVGAADSIFTDADVAKRAEQFAARKPLSFSYTSQKSLKTLNEFGGLMKTLVDYASGAKSLDLPFKLDGVIAELKTLEAKANAIWPNDPDAAIGAMWWEGGLRAEAFGGNKPRANDNSRPLGLTTLADDKTFLVMGGRSNGAFRDKVFGYLEDVASSVWNIYKKEVTPALPDDVRQGAAMGEMMALPMVKELWKSLQSFRAAMGDESAFFINLDGAMPDIPGANIPPDVVSKGKIPRIAWMNELKDRSKLAESWSGLKTLLSSAAAIAASQTGANIPTEPTAKTEGTLEMYGYKLPIDTGDLWPHTGVNVTHWFLSSSPSFTKELSTKTASPSGTPCGSRFKVNFHALWNFASDWTKILPIGDREQEVIDFALPLVRSLRGVEFTSGEEGGQSHDSFHLDIKDTE